MSKEIGKKKIVSFTDLLVWQKSHALVVALYEVTKTFPSEEVYGLTSQMRRAAISVTSNISEGFGRHTDKERTHFYYLSHGSLVELKNQLLIARDVGYLSEETFADLAEQANVVHALLRGLITKTKKRSTGRMAKPIPHTS